MGSTLIEKIIQHNTGIEKVTPGQIVTVDVDRVMIHDIFIPFAVDKFREMGFTKLWDPDKVVLIYDHMVPAAKVEDSRHFRIGDAFAAEQGMTHVHRTDGICHQLMTEMRYAKPGDIVFGTDSHTTTYGSVGCFSTGIGYTEMAGILGTGKLWIRVPETIKVVIEGKLPSNVMSKDIILRILGDLRADGATYKSLEFTGSAVREMSVASRTTMSNMAVECGAKCGLFAPDEKTCEYSGVRMEDVSWLCADEDAVYSRTLTYKAEDLVPVCACPSQVDNIKNISEVEGTEIDQVFIGSCTNGRLEDLATAARILDGKKVAVRTIVTPASRQIYLDAVKAGYMAILAKAGCIITTPGCGLCCGRSGGILTDGERVLATNNRNFLGRMGTNKVQIYLGSPASAATSAVTGRITMPEDAVRL
ncbi:MAG: 3-isopropylmalate dehydratase large subunit [Lachnospiraceae bacterium]|nr:3-isopropylmalate dehydratase large subunit [Lachnospiraceae bacterium]